MLDKKGHAQARKVSYFSEDYATGINHITFRINHILT